MDLVERALRLLRTQGADVFLRAGVLVVLAPESARESFALDIVLKHAREVQDLLREEERWWAANIVVS